MKALTGGVNFCTCEEINCFLEILSGPCTVRPTLFLNFLFHVEQTENYEIDIFFD